MAMPPALAAALASKSGGKKKAFGKGGDDDSAGPDALDIAQAAKKRLAGANAKGKKKGAIPPQFLKGK